MAINNVDISTNERLQLNEDSINSGIIDRKYGRSEDYIELHIYNQDNQLLTSDYNFTQYKFPEGSTEIISSELNMSHGSLSCTGTFWLSLLAPVSAAG